MVASYTASCRIQERNRVNSKYGGGINGGSGPFAKETSIANQHLARYVGLDQML